MGIIQSAVTQVPRLMQLPEWVEYVKALGTPIAALIGACIAGFIAYQQMRTARNKLKLDLFEKRIHVYNAAVELVAKIGDMGKIDEARGEEIIAALNSASWLLDDEVDAYLKNLKLEIRKQRDKIRTTVKAEGRIVLVSENVDFRKKHRDELKRVFEPFLKLEH